MKVNKNKIYPFLYFIVFSFFVSLIVSHRDLNLVSDNLIYVNHFNNLTNFESFKYEFLFDLITFIIRFFTDSYIVYFFVLNFLLNTFIFIVIYKISKFLNLNNYIFIPLTLALLVGSSWYHAFSGNILRQGLSVSVFFLSVCLFFFEKKNFLALLFFIFSIFIHYSSLLILPFLILMRFGYRRLFFITILTSFVYFLGFNAYLVELFSNIFKIGLYDTIINYSDADDAFSYGFDLFFLIYTAGLCLIYYFLYFLLKLNCDKFELVIKLYMCFSCYFYILGFGGYPNRYGVVAWMFSVFINSVFIYYMIRNRIYLFPVFYMILFFISFCIFVYGFLL